MLSLRTLGPLLIRKLLFLLFLGLPGFALQAVGSLGAIYYTVLFSSFPGFTWETTGILLIPVAVFVFGAAMQALYDALAQAGLPHAEFPTERALAVLLKSFALSACVTITATIILFAKGERGAFTIAWILLIVFCAGCLASIVYRRKLYRGRFENQAVESSD